ncbi:hypothetical protein LTR36_008332 [Oleoguttula mirabilis]|uniref:Uncharacterized protein n=1 Tax=Oleoguttula mirabilis TaxID=1507867 RepID=A0AAV9J8N0_9PEZI|nr:hypothetical protein LTR36_008332 [Oleoguttula mirabilis]
MLSNGPASSAPPPELRNNIYEHLFGYGGCEYYNPVLSFWGLQHCRCLDLALLRMCRQAREETFKLFYNNHSFRFTLRRSNKTAIVGWLDSIGVEGTAGMRRFHLKSYDAISNRNVHPFPAYHSWCHAGAINVELHETGTAGWITCENCNHCEQDDRSMQERVNVVLESLSLAGQKPLLTKESLLEVFEAAGWS